MHLRRLRKFILVSSLVLVHSAAVLPQVRTTTALPDSLAEVRDKHRALLLVFRSGIVDVGDGERAIVDQVLKADPEPTGRNRWAYGVIAKKLNTYIRKYRSLTAASDLSDADYVIYFNLVEYRRILNTIYPYGELFVIVKGSPETQSPPRIVWKAKKILWASDAISDLIKELKTLRGES
jgi:hypothetical protein